MVISLARLCRPRSLISLFFSQHGFKSVWYSSLLSFYISDVVSWQVKKDVALCMCRCRLSQRTKALDSASHDQQDSQRQPAASVASSFKHQLLQHVQANGFDSANDLEAPTDAWPAQCPFSAWPASTNRYSASRIYSAA